MNIEAIRALFDARLAALAPALPTAWQDVTFTPPAAGAPFQRTRLIPAPTDNPTLTERLRRDRGIYQVTVSYPAGVGPGAADRRASLIQSWFPAGLVLGAVARVRGTPAVSPPIDDPARIILAISIRYEVNT